MTGNAALITDGGWCVGPDGAARTLDGAGQAPCGCGATCTNCPCCVSALLACWFNGASNETPVPVVMQRASSGTTTTYFPTIETTWDASGSPTAPADCLSVTGTITFTRIRNGVPLPVSDQSSASWNVSSPQWPRGTPPAKWNFAQLAAINGTTPPFLVWKNATDFRWERSISGGQPLTETEPTRTTISGTQRSEHSASVTIGGDCLTTITATYTRQTFLVNGGTLVSETTETVGATLVTPILPCSGSDCSDCDNSDLEPA